MARTLTKKQKGFVKDYVATGIGSLAVKENYDVSTDETARAIAYENLTKPHIQEAVNELLSDQRINEKHSQLLDAVNLEKLWFDEHDEDETIERVVSEMPGYKLLHIVRNLKSDGEVLNVYAYVSAPDNMTQEKALDKALKRKGWYAAEKHLNMNVEVESNPEVLEAARVINDHYRQLNSGASDGVVSSPMGTETQDKE